MRIIEPSVEFIGIIPLFFQSSKDHCLELIEACGRTCYKSEDKITAGSATKFCNGVLKSGHLSVIEHSNLVMRTNDPPTSPIEVAEKLWVALRGNGFLKVVMDKGHVYVGGNLRAWMEMLDCYDYDRLTEAVQDFMAYHGTFCTIGDNSIIPKELRRYAVRIVHDRAFTHEIVRMRPCSFSQESQRYVRYGDVVFIKPLWFGQGNDDMDRWFTNACEDAEKYYGKLLKVYGLRPEQARDTLPNACKTEIVISADHPEWEWIFHLRHAMAAHPDMRQTMGVLIPLMQQAGIEFDPAAIELN